MARSRGLGDVYKRQQINFTKALKTIMPSPRNWGRRWLF
jgi:hypothetical protein